MSVLLEVSRFQIVTCLQCVTSISNNNDFKGQMADKAAEVEMQMVL
jgi:hypothetical protein